MLDNTQAQTKAIEEGDMDGLASLMDKREEIMADVDQLDQKSSHIIPELTTDQKQAMKDLLGQMIALDQKNQAFISKESQSAQEELRRIRTGRKQEKNYGTEYGLYKEEGVFFDTKE